ncbi:MAG: hypothetical protein WDN28_10395 [Chthoniobacter sp.]
MPVPGLSELVSSEGTAANSTAAAPGVTAGPATANQANIPGLSPGHQSSEFYLALVIVAAIFAALWNGKLDPALASTLLGLIVSGYPALRTWLKAQHVGAVAAVLAAQGGRGGIALATLAGAVDGSNETNGSKGNDGKPRTNLPAAALLLVATLLALSGCSQGPYYVSGINGTVDTSKDGGRITGGGVGVTISPNPYYPLPPSQGFTK